MKLFNENDDVVIGEILSPHGIGGMLKVFPYSDFSERIDKLHEAELVRETTRRSMAVEKASLYGRFWLIKFQGVDTREEARRLSGSLLVIPKDKRMYLPEGRFYYDQLIGLQIYSPDDELLGLIIDIITTGGHDLFLVEQAGGEGKKALIPAVKKFIRQVDLGAGRIVADLPEGLLDL